MEHLVLTGGAKPGPDEDVLYYAREDYKGIPFKDYLRHIQSEQLALYSDGTLKEMSALYQTWLFFCLLQEVLGPRLFCHEDYVCTRLDARGLPGTFITTEKLIPAMEAWRDDALNTQRSPKEYEHIASCFRDIETSRLEAANVERNIAISIRSVAAVLALHLWPIFQKSPDSFDGFNRIHANDLAIMIANGWCPFEAAQAWMSFRSVQTQMLLRTSIRTTLPSQDHSKCSLESCQYAIIPEGFIPEHDTHGCSCPKVLFEPTRYEEYFYQNRVCVLEVVFDSTDPQSKVMSIDLVGADSNCEYTAISHVWADGLGNATENALPRCRVEMTARKIRALLKPPADDQPMQRSVRIWLDVICCPLNPPDLRTKGIAQLRDVYQQASRVLVLDGHLERLKAEKIDDVDLAVHILTSKWTRRLWTLQEAIMARKLYFRFADRYVEATNLREALFDHWCARIPTLHGAYMDLITSINILRYSGLSEDYGFKHTFYDVPKAVCLRSVSVSTDEALCLGTLIGERFPFVETFEGQNMAEFWKICAARSLVHSNVIFHEAPRLKVKYSQWAPESLLYSSHKSHPGQVGTLASDDRKLSANWHSRGLEVVYRGVVSTLAGTNTSYPALVRDVQDQEVFRFILVYDSTSCTWWGLKLLLSRDEAKIGMSRTAEKQLAVIRKHANGFTATHLIENYHVGGALLAWVDEEAVDKVFAEPITPGVFWKHGDAFSSILSRVFLDASRPTTDELVGKIAGIDLGNYDLRMHRLTGRRRRETPRIITEYAEWLLERAALQQYLLCSSISDEPRTWVVG